MPHQAALPDYSSCIRVSTTTHFPCTTDFATLFCHNFRLEFLQNFHVLFFPIFIRFFLFFFLCFAFLTYNRVHKGHNVVHYIKATKQHATHTYKYTYALMHSNLRGGVHMCVVVSVCVHARVERVKSKHATNDNKERPKQNKAAKEKYKFKGKRNLKVWRWQAAKMYAQVCSRVCACVYFCSDSRIFGCTTLCCTHPPALNSRWPSFAANYTRIQIFLRKNLQQQRQRVAGRGRARLPIT